MAKDDFCARCRRENEKLFLKGERCNGPRCSFTRRSYAPGEHGNQFKKLSDYGLQLSEKQKAKAIYGLREKQFRNYFDEAVRRKGPTGEILLQLLEKRLDNVVFRLGFANSRGQSRQIISHAHIKVNGKKVNIPSYQIKKGDKVEVSDKAKTSIFFKNQQKILVKYTPPVWLKTEKDLKGEVKELPKREDIDTAISEQPIIEFYSR